MNTSQPLILRGVPNMESKREALRRPFGAGARTIVHSPRHISTSHAFDSHSIIATPARTAAELKARAVPVHPVWIDRSDGANFNFTSGQIKESALY